MSTEREEILSDELTRLQPAGLRPFSLGILRLCKKLGLAIISAEGKKLTPEQAEAEMLIIAWLIDARHSLVEVCSAAERGRDYMDRLILPPYEFAVEPAFLMRVKAEVQRVNRAVEETLFEVQPKPGGDPGPAPPGN